MKEYFSTVNRVLAGGLLCSALVLGLTAEGFAQGIDSLGENTDLYRVNPGDPWGTGNTRVDSVYLGAAFLRDSSKAFKVWLNFSETSSEGSLYLYIPHGANNGTDTAIFLFKNTAAIGTNVDLTNDPVVKANIQHLDTIFFRYVSTNGGIGVSGPNRAPGEGRVPGETWQEGTDYVWSPDTSTRLLTGPNGSFRIGRRWCTAGWIRNQTTNMRTDTVKFAFEDWHDSRSDMDLNDIIFNVTGIFLMYPVSKINVTVFPSDTLEAGDTAIIIGELKDQTGKVLKSLGDSISWYQLPPILTGDKLLTTKNDSTFVTATVAYRSMGIVGTFIQGGVTVIDTAWLYIEAAAPDTLVIEPDSNALAASPNRARPLGTVTIGPTQPNARGYAVIRDRFENFVGYSQNTLWSSSQTTVVTIPANGGGKTTVGEGVFTKVAGVIGTSRVDAKDNATGLTGTVTINTEQVTYSPLRIVVGDSTDITYLEMPSDQDTTLKVLGKRSTDGVWWPISGNWTYTATLGGMTASGLSWEFKPTDTGSGKIVVTFGPYSTPDTLIVKIVPGRPRTMAIYNSEGVPGPTVNKLPDPSTLITVAAGTDFLLVGKVFDWKGVWLSQYQLSNLKNKMVWGVYDRLGNLNSTLDGLTGAVKHFKPTKAYDTVTIVDTLKIDSLNIMLLDTVRFYITPGPAKSLVIEPKGPINLNRPNELDTLIIPDKQNSNAAYTTVRDAFGNFVRYGNIWLWGSLDTMIVSVVGGNALFGEGIASRYIGATDSITTIFANDSTLTDSCIVNLAKFYYTDLRIVIGNDTNPSGLVMNTNQDITLKAQGMRSNDSQWVDISVTWENTANLKIDPAASTGVTWSFSPLDTGTGWIRITLNNDGITKPDTLPVVFNPGPPVRASIEIITPGAQIIAGKPIQAVVRVYDKDGNSYTYKYDTQNGGAAYHDLLGTGGVTFPEPFIIIDNDTVKLYGTPWDKGNETFLNGSDTVSFTLYNAPLDTTKRHQIFTNLITGTDTIRASSTPFVLHPDVIAEVRIEYPNGTPVTDTLPLTNFIIVTARGYDRYGNPYGEITGTWTVTDSLHPIAGQTNGSSISYDPSVATKNERGFIIVDHNGIRDSVYIIISGPMIKLVSAITRDLSGNGILDRMELHFSRPFELPANASFAGLTIVANLRDTLTIGRILNTGTGVDTSVWIVELVERDTTRPQTAWTPKIILPRQNAYDLDTAAITATDGAGPVVWSVVTFPVVADDHHFDTVVVTFSEPVQRYDGGSLNPADRPADIFYVWQKDASNTQFILVKEMFAGIGNLKRDPGKSNTITFTMTNGNDLNRAYYLSFGDSTRRYVTDTTAYAVAPNLNNNPKRVEIGFVLGPITATNPIRPTFKRDAAGVFPIENRPEAKDWPAIDKGGAVIKVTFPTMPLEETKATLKYTIRIYDVIGNTVQSGEEADFLHKKYDLKELENQSTAEAIVYWNGSNAAGMAVAPGVYRAVVYLQYSGISSKNSGKFKTQRYVVRLGIRK